MLHEYRDLISDLKGKDAHFDKLFERHNELDDQIKNAEKSQISTLSDTEISNLKKEKLHVKDELKKYLENYKK
ncbi:YdcH family protein [Campylobacter sp. LH-2024]|uniref:YdcH family protein n=1 Tax=Campylobacter molothri TaxID=1032242 RepID=A0ACC5W0M7_9BACT|nr:MULTISPECIES: YdcH family protein [unclassified Campylobacter]MBZ7929077.1 YdcH family protein [Campylobacter sp. RM10542]MBZ7929389.1 YdcH family protein [Campylobacter sp. W0067]MBZ7931582.1 YdcH family protein [Campylobacter sp. RM12910]MBZ7932889.1 YdcH family protein [Campylobacter sp. RM10543]MBZ7933973.1 YdcH family protein [Campylobacter sp. W0065]MBZ7937189.1 YdcH family protein [Campylobacter sp. RM10538]MBZ7940661.1 YdcH family protein [Campylobacter sp. W0047]MBZ7943531.1 Ydc